MYQHDHSSQLLAIDWDIDCCDSFSAILAVFSQSEKDFEALC